MSIFTAWNSTQLTTALVAAGIVLLWHWAILGHRQLTSSVHGELVRSRNVAISSGLLLCLMASAATFWVADPKLMTIPLICAALFVHAALEPSRETFWHHRRIRLTYGGLLILGAIVAGWLISPAYLPLMGAVLIFDTHHRQYRRFMRRLLLDIDQLNRHNISLSSSVHNQRLIPSQSGGDIRLKAS